MLDIENWMEPWMCVTDDWFRYFSFAFGSYIMITYLLFAYEVRFNLIGIIKRLLTGKFAVFLAWVFVLCALTHMVHSTAYLTKWVKPALLLTYPFLAYYHTRLILDVQKIRAKLGGLKSNEEWLEIEKERDLLRRQVDRLLRDAEQRDNK